MPKIAPAIPVCPRGLPKHLQAFHGTKLAHDNRSAVDYIEERAGPYDPHNLKVVGSNPAPATNLPMNTAG
jgi:hypothetical protein